MRFVITGIFVLFVMMWGCVTCTVNSRGPSPTNVQRSNTETTIQVAASAAEGLDLKAVGALVKNVKSAEELERELNKANGINNLDLNSDGTVDFIKVTEFGNKSDEFGFSLTTEPVKGEVQELATITVIKEESQAQVQVSGNHNVYGSGHHYHASHSLTSLLLMGYLLRPHPYWAPGYGYGMYPGYYGSYRTVNRTTYVNRTNSYNSNSNMARTSASNMRKTSINSPNKGKTAKSGISKSLANPSKTQKQFQARSASKAVKSGGFGKANAQKRAGASRSSSQRSGSVRNRSSSRRSSGFGK